MLGGEPVPIDQSLLGIECNEMILSHQSSNQSISQSNQFIDIRSQIKDALKLQKPKELFQKHM